VIDGTYQTNNDEQTTQESDGKRSFHGIERVTEGFFVPPQDYYTNIPINTMRPNGSTRKPWGILLIDFAPMEAV
jgi:hypothetical protein